MTNKSLKSILFTGTIVAGSLLSTSTASANPFSFTDLGSGSQLRTALLDNLISQKYNLDLSCGEKTKDNSKSDSKTKDAKCGEGKCGGDGKCGDKSDTTKMHMKDMKKMDSKTKDAKCGEGKCGDSKSTEKKTTDKK
ncbi:MAG: hypothetical protein IPJ23_00435 [Ignavibacteriales bacterium]|nr:hypothetical protein [Ignavibacteriales bacterium]